MNYTLNAHYLTWQGDYLQMSPLSSDKYKPPDFCGDQEIQSSVNQRPVNSEHWDGTKNEIIELNSR